METEPRLTALHTLLNYEKANYEIFKHAERLITATDGPNRGIGTMDESAPTFILKTKNGYIAVILKGNMRISYKKLKKSLGIKDISLASPEEVLQVTGSQIGAVSLVQTQLPTFVDQQLLNSEFCYGGCGIFYHTLKIRINDLIQITHATVLDFAEKRENGAPERI
jgi:prolyl-tRNA editing enzyme YbaK/EbsC (Cys-tRNA(Pro) deacylase)